MQNNLDYKLNKVTTVIGDMKRNLRLDDNAPMDLKNLINIFVQEEEPACKDGVWLQTTPFDFVDFTIDENLHIKGELEGEDRWPVDTKPNKYVNSSTGDATGYYVVYGATIYRYLYNDYTTITWHTMANDDK